DADVVLCMHQGLEAAGGLRDLWSGRPIGTRVQVRCVRIPARQVPSDPFAWLQERWDEVDAFVTLHQEAPPAPEASREPTGPPRGRLSSAR
ncbi:MAG TPA: hypothetical protein VNL37_01515, partial [Candidatus Polarisedimenticolia bacterium]|nr:hypothetical protein [Candidatus Polarisedimenticolia bacterium]